MFSVHGKNGIHLIFLRNLLLKCFPQWSLTPKIKPKRSRGAVFRTPRVWKVHWPMLAVKPWAKTTGGSTCLNSGRAYFSEEFLTLSTAAEQLEFIRRKLKVERGIVNEISSLTVGQRNNPSWHLVRKWRLTASNFGSVIDAKRVTPSLIKRLLGEYDISWLKAVAWGVTNEVVETGVWLDESGVLGASPDRLVGEDHVLEAKCSYTLRNASIEGALKSETFCLEKNKDGSYSLKRNHVYWHQVQGQMYLELLLFCCLDK